ncbi:MAG: hypothetical protein L0Y66_00555 [Myxococcaceae bacterium]|nr:hypothetical protein [Myxococcaceae bacterium]MCI0671598.1 hypothetical protein [Myxococcaceae bacterium]
MLKLLRAMRQISRGDVLFRRGAFSESLGVYAEALRLLADPKVHLATPWGYSAAIGALRSYVQAALEVGDRRSAGLMLESWHVFLVREPAPENVELDVDRAELLEIHRGLCETPAAPTAPR